MINTENAHTFAGLQVKDFNSGDNLSDFDNCAVRLSVNYDDFEAGKTIADILNELIEKAEVSTIKALIIGAWGEEYEVSPAVIVDFLIVNNDKFANLKAIFMGDITYEQCEISWIQQCAYQKLLAAYPGLEQFKVRGSEGLGLGELNHQNLKSLILESGGLPSAVIKSIVAAQLPALEHLELWLGTDEYGFDGSIETIKPLLNSKNFPRLIYFGLRDSIIADEIAQALSASSLVALIKHLDLSMGALGDKGAQAILENTLLGNLESLDLHYHYISEEWTLKLQQLPFPVNVDDRQESEMDDGREWRYIAVSE